MKFRTDINALRAFAVFIVVFYHFNVPGFGGGFAGVDVFFVISGFLMTGIIFRRLEAQQFSIFRFYVERAFRIIPALIVLCVVLLGAGWLLLPSTEYMVLGKHVAGALTFVSNHIFRAEAGYFDAASHEKWLLHTWSLSAEWQFYLLYPLAMLVLSKLCRLSLLRWFVLAAAVSSFMLSLYVTKISPTTAFYLLPTRAWEMLAGGLIYCFPRKLFRRKSYLATCGVVILLLANTGLDGSASWPGWLALIPVVGACLIILAEKTDSPIFANVLIQFLGKISYSVYLWHWPIVVLLNRIDRLDRPLWIAGGIGMSFLMGYLSYQFVETPIRVNGAAALSRFTLGIKVFPIMAMVVVVSATGLVLFKLEGVPGNARAVNLDPKNVFLAKYEHMHKEGIQRAYREECDFYDWKKNKARTAIDSACTGTRIHVPVFLWGDSHAQALSLGLRHAYPRSDDVAQVATSACRPSLLPQKKASGVDNNCDLANRYALVEISRLKPQMVVLAQQVGHEDTDWDALAEHLLAAGVKKVVLIGPMPNWHPSLPVVFVRKYWGSSTTRVAQGLAPALFATDDLLQRRYGASHKLTYVSLTQKLCNQDGCIGVVPKDGSLLVLDYGHLTPSGSEYVGDAILTPAIQSRALASGL